MKYIIDSFAWIEYFEGSNIGNVVKEYIESDNELYSINLTISEVVSRFKRKNLDPEPPYKAIISLSKVLDITPIIAKKAGILHAELKKKYHNLGLVDALIITLSRDQCKNCHR
jgi:predicted nucleic acid-binding protein